LSFKSDNFFWPILQDFTKIRTNDRIEAYYKEFNKVAAVLAVYFLIAFGATGYFFSTISYNDADKYPECVGTIRRKFSICHAWFAADCIISFLTIAAVRFEFYVGKKEFSRMFRNRALFAHLFACDKFMKDDLYEDKNKLVDLALDEKVKQILKNDRDSSESKVYINTARDSRYSRSVIDCLERDFAYVWPAQYEKIDDESNETYKAE
jgi:hypothetical protein